MTLPPLPFSHGQRTRAMGPTIRTHKIAIVNDIPDGPAPPLLACLFASRAALCFSWRADRAARSSAGVRAAMAFHFALACNIAAFLRRGNSLPSSASVDEPGVYAESSSDDSDIPLSPLSLSLLSPETRLCQSIY